MTIVARFNFKQSRASEFLDIVELDGKEFQPTVTELQVEDIEEVMDYVDQFNDALLDCNAIVDGKVINLSDFAEPA
jgi:hypothetical protein